MLPIKNWSSVGFCKRTMNFNGTLSWSIEKVANALKIGVEDVREYFTDGRRVAFIIKRRISKAVVRGHLTASEGAAFDLVDESGGKWEVRSISKGEVYFCPSYMVGSGRSFELTGFLKKLEAICGYILPDIDSYPNVPSWIIDKQIVKNWWEQGELGITTKISRDKTLRLLRKIP